MNGTSTPELLARIDAACEAFEDAHRAGGAPAIERFLDGWAEPDRAVLFGYLLELDADLRRGRGDAPTVAEYAGRFPEYRAGVERALAGQGSTAGGPRAADATLAAAPPTAVGPYRVVRVLGRGGWGTVYLARHEHLRREVALKLLHVGPELNADAVARFRREAEAIARIQHPNIIQIFEVGEFDGTPFLALEYVVGGTLAAALDGTPWPSRRAAELLHPLAAAAHTAHLAGVVHRDLKPSNVLLVGARGEGSGASKNGPSLAPDPSPLAPTPKVADFGLAKVLEGSQDRTATGTFLGTPSYAAPEQAAGHSADIDARTDVYALGAVLYELLTGRPPFRGTTITETLGQVLHRDPVPPRLLNPAADRDLETVCLKCLEKPRDRRYATAQALADDLWRYLDGRPIVARPLSTLGRSARWCRRNRGLAAALAVLAVVALGVVAGSAVVAAWSQAQARTEAELREHADRLRGEADGALGDAKHARDVAVRALGEADRARGEAERARDETRQNLYRAHMTLAARAAEAPGGVGRLRELVAYWRPRPGLADPRGWEWYLFHATGRTEDRVLNPKDIVQNVRWSPDGKGVAVGDLGGQIVVLDPATGARVGGVRHGLTTAPRFEWSPDGSRLAACGPDAAVVVLDPRAGRRTHRWEVPAGDKAVAWHPDGDRLAVHGPDRRVRVFRLAAPAEVREVTDDVGPVPRTFGFSKDGRWLASLGGSPATGHAVVVWGAAALTPARRLLINRVGAAVAWHPDGRRLAVATTGGEVQVWDAVAGTPLHTLASAGAAPFALAWSPDGGRLAAGDLVGRVRVWDAAGEELGQFVGHETGVAALSWHPDGRTLATTDSVGGVRVWNTGTPPPVWARGVARPGVAVLLHSVVWKPGTRLVSGFVGKEFAVTWDAATGGRVATTPAAVAGWSHSGRYAATLDGQTVTVHDLTGASPPARFGVPGRTVRFAWSPRDDRLAVRAGQSLQVWEPGGAARVYGEPGGRDEGWFALGVAWSPDGRELAFSTQDDRGHRLSVWDADKRAVTRSRQTRDHFVALAWSPDGGTLAAGGPDPAVVRLSAKSLADRPPLRGHAQGVADLAWHPDGSRLASAARDKTVKVWDAAAGEEVVTFNLDGEGRGVAWSTDGRALAAIGFDGLVRVWDATRGYERADR